MTASTDWGGAITALAASGTPPSEAAIAHLVGARDVRLGGAGARAERARLESGLLGLGELTDAGNDPRVTDILVNGDGQVWVDRGGSCDRLEVVLEPGAARTLAVRLAGLAGRRLDDAQPWVDGLLPSGIRLHAILPPLVSGGAHLSLRIPRVAPEGLEGLVTIGALAPTARPVVRQILDRGLSFLVVGGTGSGKTTFAGGLLAACPASDRIIIVEDVRELAPRHPHVVHLMGRAPNVEGRGGVSLVDLVRQALRMRPDRLVVGEVRGPEVRELLAALNTGHTGGGGTIHANSISDAPARLEALGALAGLSERAVATQVVGGVQVVFGMSRAGPRRWLDQIGVVRRADTGAAVVDLALDLRRGRLDPGPGAEALALLLEGAC